MAEKQDPTTISFANGSELQVIASPDEVAAAIEKAEGGRSGSSTQTRTRSGSTPTILFTSSASQHRTFLRPDAFLT